MFDKLKAMGSMLSMLPKLQGEVEKFQQKVGEIVAEGQAGGGMVTVKVNGRREVLSVTITDEAVRDKELLEDLIKSAVNQAMEKVQAEVSAKMSEMAQSMGLPPGMSIPGMS